MDMTIWHESNRKVFKSAKEAREEADRNLDKRIAENKETVRNEIYHAINGAIATGSTYCMYISEYAFVIMQPTINELKELGYKIVIHQNGIRIDWSK